MRWEIKRIRELEKTLRCNNNAELDDEYQALHRKIRRPFPRDYERSLNVNQSLLNFQNRGLQNVRRP